MNAQSKPVSPNVIQQAATRLIEDEGGTSSLIVRQYLYNQGYDVRQNDVADQLTTIALRDGWAIDDDGPFRVYHFATTFAQLA